MSKLLVGVDTAFDVGVEEGRKQMARLVISLLESAKSDSAVKTVMQCYLTDAKTQQEVKKLLEKASSSNGQGRSET